MIATLDENNPGPSRVAFHGKKSEDQKLRAEETSTQGCAVDHGVECWNGPTSECFRSHFIRQTIYLGTQPGTVVYHRKVIVGLCTWHPAPRGPFVGHNQVDDPVLSSNL